VAADVSSRWRRRSPPDRATSTARQEPGRRLGVVHGSRYSTRSRALVRLSWAARAPAVVRCSRASSSSSRPSTSWASSSRRSRSDRWVSAVVTAWLASRSRTASSGRATGSRSTTRCRLRPAVSCCRHVEATALRAVVMAYGTAVAGSMRSHAASTLARTSWTRSSTRCRSRDPRADDATHDRADLGQLLRRGTAARPDLADARHRRPAVGPRDGAPAKRRPASARPRHADGPGRPIGASAGPRRTRRAAAERRRAREETR
jgi:hypothetical protein